VIDSAAIVNGNTIDLDTMITDWLVDDYSISFYFRSNNMQAFIDLISIRNQCNQDSALAITYLAGSDEVEVLMSLNDNNRRRFKGSINPDVCWHQVTLVKSGLNVLLYLDNALANEEVLPLNISYSEVVPMRINGSPCQGITDSPLDGAIDELKIYDRPLSATEIFNSYQYPGQIISNDTTIFEGASVDIRTGKSCAASTAWTPSGSLDDPSSPMPTATPTLTTTYEVTFSDGACQARDEITINVLDPSQLTCDTLLLPAAFTPNGDFLNDEYGISNRFIVDDLESFIIRDRWGSIVFETTDKNETWDGTFGGQAPNPGTYLYTINYTCAGDEYSAVGSFVLLR
jgi:gliding motility-associated-like protein